MSRKTGKLKEYLESAKIEREISLKQDDYKQLEKQSESATQIYSTRLAEVGKYKSERDRIKHRLEDLHDNLSGLERACMGLKKMTIEAETQYELEMIDCDRYQKEIDKLKKTKQAGGLKIDKFDNVKLQESKKSLGKLSGELSAIV